MFVMNKQVLIEQLDPKSTRKILAYDGSLMMVEVTFKKGGVGALHSHEKHEQISYILNGSFEVILDKEKKVLKQGDSFYAPLNTEHGVTALEDSMILDVFTPIREDFLKK